MVQPFSFSLIILIIVHALVIDQALQRLLHRDLIIIELVIARADVIGVAGLRLAHRVDPIELRLYALGQFPVLIRLADTHHQVKTGCKALAPGLEGAHGLLALRIGEAGLAHSFVEVDVVCALTAGGLVRLQCGPRHVVVLLAAAQLELFGLLGHVRLGQAEALEQALQLHAALLLYRPAAGRLRFRRLLRFLLPEQALLLFALCFCSCAGFGVKHLLLHYLAQIALPCRPDRIRRIQELHQLRVSAQLICLRRRQDGMGLLPEHRPHLFVQLALIIMICIGDQGLILAPERFLHGKDAQHRIYVFPRGLIALDGGNIVFLCLLAGRNFLAGNGQRQVALPQQHLGVVGKLRHLRPFLLLDAAHHGVKIRDAVVLSYIELLAAENVVRQPGVIGFYHGVHLRTVAHHLEVVGVGVRRPELRVTGIHGIPIGQMGDDAPLILGKRRLLRLCRFQGLGFRHIETAFVTRIERVLVFLERAEVLVHLIIG